MSSMNLVEWTVAFIKYKDAVTRRTENINQDIQSGKVLVKLKNGTEEKYLCQDDLEKIDLASLSDERVVCLNKTTNLDWLIKNWDKLASTKSRFIFVNPKLSESWAVTPHVHHIVTEKTALRPGLKSLFDTVPEIA